MNHNERHNDTISQYSRKFQHHEWDTKHIELDLFFVGEKVIGKHLQVVHVPAADQRVVILTKALTPSNFTAYRFKVVEKHSTNPSSACRGY